MSVEQCKKHIIGHCAGTPITSFIDPAVKTFLVNITEFTTSRRQVNHPGFMILTKHCTECGMAVEYDKNKQYWDNSIDKHHAL